jgi:hypothetical protein
LVAFSCGWTFWQKYWAWWCLCPISMNKLFQKQQNNAPPQSLHFKISHTRFFGNSLFSHYASSKFACNCSCIKLYQTLICVVHKVYIPIHLHVHVPVHIQIHTQTPIHIHVHIRIHIHIHIHIHFYSYILICFLVIFSFPHTYCIHVWMANMCWLVSWYPFHCTHLTSCRCVIGFKYNFMSSMGMDSSRSTNCFMKPKDCFRLLQRNKTVQFKPHQYALTIFARCCCCCCIQSYKFNSNKYLQFIVTKNGNVCFGMTL